MASEPSDPGIGWDCGRGWPGRGGPWWALIGRSIWVAASPTGGAAPPETGGRTVVASEAFATGGSGAPVCGVARTSSPDGPVGCSA